MALDVTVESKADFRQLATRQQQRPAAAPASPLELAGYRYVTSRAMQRLPQYRRHAGRWQVGPDLTHLASRRTHRRRTLPMNSGQPLRLGRRSAVAEARQPDAEDRPMQPDELHAVVAYLETLK